MKNVDKLVLEFSPRKVGVTFSIYGNSSPSSADITIKNNRQEPTITPEEFEQLSTRLISLIAQTREILFDSK